MNSKVNKYNPCVDVKQLQTLISNPSVLSYLMELTKKRKGSDKDIMNDDNNYHRFLSHVDYTTGCVHGSFVKAAGSNTLHGHPLQGLSRELRNYLLHENMVEIDIEMCHQMICIYLGKILQIDVSTFEYMRDHREECLLLTGREDAKQYYLRVLNGSKDKVSHPFVKKYKEQSQNLICEIVNHPEFQHIFEHKKGKASNKKACIVYQKFVTDIITHTEDFLLSQNCEIGYPLCDGIYIQKKEINLPALSEYIYGRTSIQVQFKIKEIHRPVIQTCTSKQIQTDDEYGRLKSFTDRKEKILKITAPMGSGKSYQMIRSMMEKIKRKESIIIITPRQTLAYSVLEELNKQLDFDDHFKGFQSYLDVKDPNECKYLVIQYESLHRMIEMFDHVFIDETRGIMTQACSIETNGKHLKQNFDILRLLIKESKQTVLLDADMNVDGMVNEFINHLYIKNSNIYEYECTEKRITRHVKVKNKDVGMQEMIQSVKNNERIFICCATKSKAEEINLLLGKYIQPSDITLYKSDECENIDDLKNVDQVWCKKQVVIITSKVTVGIDCSKVVFSKIFMYPARLGASPTQLMQMSGRTREVSSKEIIICPLYDWQQDSDSVTKQYIQNVYKEIERKRVGNNTYFDAMVKDQKYIFDLSKITLDKNKKIRKKLSLLGKLCCYAEAEKKIQLTNALGFLLYLAREKGYSYQLYYDSDVSEPELIDTYGLRCELKELTVAKYDETDISSFLRNPVEVQDKEIQLLRNNYNVEKQKVLDKYGFTMNQLVIINEKIMVSKMFPELKLSYENVRMVTQNKKMITNYFALKRFTDDELYKQFEERSDIFREVTEHDPYLISRVLKKITLLLGLTSIDDTSLIKVDINKLILEDIFQEFECNGYACRKIRNKKDVTNMTRLKKVLNEAIGLTFEVKRIGKKQERFYKLIKNDIIQTLENNTKNTIFTGRKPDDDDSGFTFIKKL